MLLVYVTLLYLQILFLLGSFSKMCWQQLCFWYDKLPLHSSGVVDRVRRSEELSLRQQLIWLSLDELVVPADMDLRNVSLPPHLSSLVFCDHFNVSLANVRLPAGLQSLKFGDGFNQSMQSVVLPASLLSLIFGNAFDQSLANVVMPAGLQLLTLGHHYSHDLPNVPSGCLVTYE